MEKTQTVGGRRLAAALVIGATLLLAAASAAAFIPIAECPNCTGTGWTDNAIDAWWQKRHPHEMSESRRKMERMRGFCSMGEVDAYCDRCDNKRRKIPLLSAWLDRYPGPTSTPR